VIRWYADNSELHGIWAAEIPDILLYGGICMGDSSRYQLESIFKDVKAQYDQRCDFPLKWNIRDLRDYYQRQDREDLYERLLQSSEQWRRQIFREISRVDFSIIASLILGYGTNRDVLIRTRDGLMRYVFSNALMRVGLHVSDIGPERAEVILDWPPQGKRYLFDEEYRSGYIDGITHDRQVTYDSGPLRNLGFSDAPFFANMNDCVLLQLSDLIIGAVKDMVNIALGRTRGRFGLNRVREVRRQLRGAPNNVIGRGISISPNRGDLFERVSRTVQNLFIELS
jgi:hypothetical protein